MTRRPKLPGTFFFGRASHGRHRKGEEGVILVLWTAGLTAIAGFLALAIDYGYGVQASSNIQTAANAAALAAASVLAGDTPQAGCGGPAILVSTPSQEASEEAESIAMYCYGITGDWTKCGSNGYPGLPTGFPPTGFAPVDGSNCIESATDYAGNTVVWVGLPPQDIPSLFLSNGGATVSRVAFAQANSTKVSGEPQLCYMTSDPGNC